MSETYIEIMLQSLKKKDRVLDEIIRINTIQKEGLENPELTADEFDKTVEAKAELIEQLLQLDSGFEKLFEKMKDELEGNKEKYALQIKEMQTYIKKVTDKSVEIQTQEARNKDLMTKKFSDVKRQVRQIKTGRNVADKYYKSMSKLDNVAPQFMDNKN